ncbi:MAG: hypothetical protein ACK40G_14305 [Cytophagaceae bacterium]
MEINHNESEGRFTIVSDLGSECIIKYKKLSNKLWDFYQIFAAGSGDLPEIKERIITYAMNFVKSNHIRIKASCPPIQEFLIRHRELKEVIYYPY